MRTGTVLSLAAAVLCVAPAASLAAPQPPADVASAVGQKNRTADNVKLDASRKPTEILRYLGLRKGDRVLDLFGGNLYWAELTAPAVGQAGHVTIWEPTQFADAETKTKLDSFVSQHLNVSWVSSPMETPSLEANSFDFALINLDYHDVYWTSEKYKISRMQPDAWLKTLYAAMKPGSTVGVIDHVAKTGEDPRVSVEKMHRIDPAIVSRDFRTAGFVLVGSSPILRNPADDHTLLVFDPKIRGKPDRFVYKFRKPAK